MLRNRTNKSQGFLKSNSQKEIFKLFIRVVLFSIFISLLNFKQGETKKNQEPWLLHEIIHYFFYTSNT